MAQAGQLEKQVGVVETPAQRVEAGDGVSGDVKVLNEFAPLAERAAIAGVDNGGPTEFLQQASLETAEDKQMNAMMERDYEESLPNIESHPAEPLRVEDLSPDAQEIARQGGQMPEQTADAGMTATEWDHELQNLITNGGYSEKDAASELIRMRGQRPAEVIGESTDSVVDADEQAQRMTDSEAFVDQEDRQAVSPEVAPASDAVGAKQEEPLDGSPEVTSPEDEAKTRDGIRREVANSLIKYGAEIESGAENALDIRAGAISQERAAGISRSLEQQATTLDAKAVDLEGQRLQAYRQHQAKMEEAKFGPVAATAENLNQTPDTLKQITAREKMQKQWEAQAQKYDRQIAEAKSEAEKMRKLATQTEELTKAEGPLPAEEPEASNAGSGEGASSETKGGGDSPEAKDSGSGSEAKERSDEDHGEPREGIELHFDERNLKSMEIAELQKEMQRTSEFAAKMEAAGGQLEGELIGNIALQKVLQQNLEVWQAMAEDTFGSGTGKVHEIAQKKIAEINQQLSDQKAEEAEIREDIQMVEALRVGLDEYQGKISKEIEAREKKMQEQITAETVDIPQSILDAIGNNPTLLKRFQQKRKRKGASQSLLDMFVALGNARKS